MMPASNQGVGENVGFPDVCNTPSPSGVLPITYPNQGSNAVGLPFTPTVFVSMMPGHNQDAEPSLTNGDNAGTSHSSFMRGGGNNCGNLLVSFGGSAAETLTNPCQGNDNNCSSDAKLVPSITNVLVSFDRPAALALAALGDHPGFVPPVSWRLGAGGVAHLVVRRCSWGAPQAAARALSEVARRGARAVVLDLCGNPGGDLGVAAALASAFLAPGTLVAQAGAWAYRCATAPGPAARLPLVIRVDERTASAAEVLALALQHTGRAVVCGPPSFGKLEARPLLGGSGLRVTDALGARAAQVWPDHSRARTLAAACDLAGKLALAGGTR